MAQESSDAVRWALLLGVEVAVTGQNRSLKGAVADITAVDKYISTCETPIDVTILTTQSSDVSDLPSYQNVIGALQRVIQRGSSGDYVYIHFSGHGSRMKDGALALVLYDAGPLGSRYLYGSILRSAINKMAEKDMHVTLVLDCCFSGSVLRTGRLQGSAVRYLEYNPSVDHHSDRSNPFEVEDQEGTRGSALALPRGDGPGRRLLDPSGYTVISAAESHEEASEIEIGNGDRRGALSYFLLDSLVTLRKRRVQISHQSLHQHLRASFHSRYAQQTPLLLGRSGTSFFDGIGQYNYQGLVPAYRDIHGVLTLDAGEAHGVHDTDEYALYPFTASEKADNLPEELCIKARVKRVQHLKSQLDLMDASDNTRVENGSTWKAKMLTSLSLHRAKVLLMRSLPNADDLINTGRECSFLKLLAESNRTKPEEPQDRLPDEAFMIVDINKDSIYEVQDERSVKFANLPSIYAHDAGANQLLLKALEHLATYKYFEQIENRIPNSDFEASFSLGCLDRIPDSDGLYRLSHGEELCLTFKNLDTVPKYLSILNFTSSWEILNLVSDAGEGCSFTIAANGDIDSGDIEIPLEMKVPQHLLAQGLQQTDDIVKIFITSEPTTFPLMLLPRIDAGELRGDRSLTTERIKDLIWGLSNMRGGNEGDWTTQTFLVRTTQQ
ncbi:hypothetical protein F4781DRAFT_414539 [Annulohypoxylon bovei var. microspora]|nr:hypothetical protein F4781DRAFT_414539 [Annulohypoxylon bovei var. microspora]